MSIIVSYGVRYRIRVGIVKLFTKTHSLSPILRPAGISRTINPTAWKRLIVQATARLLSATSYNENIRHAEVATYIGQGTHLIAFALSSLTQVHAYPSYHLL